MSYNLEGVAQIFSFDTLVCVNGTDLKGYMKQKHSWDDKTFHELLDVYKRNLDNITIKTNEKAS